MTNYDKLRDLLIDAVNDDVLKAAYQDLEGVVKREALTEVDIVRQVLSVLFQEFEGELRDGPVTTCDCMTPLELEDVDRGYCPNCMRRLNLVMWRLPVERSV